MWYEQKEGYMRAPVPSAFDHLVRELEEDDSVVFNSISLPSLHPQRAESPRLSSNKKTEQKSNDQQGVRHWRDTLFELSDDFISSEDEQEIAPPTTTPVDVQSLLNRIQELEEMNQQKDDKIATLQKKITEYRSKSQIRQQKPKSAIPERNNMFFKEKYEKTKMELDRLKEALAVDGKIKKVSRKSAHAIKVRPLT